MEKPQKRGQVPHPSSSKTPKLAAFQRSPTIFSLKFVCKFLASKLIFFHPNFKF